MATQRSANNVCKCGLNIKNVYQVLARRKQLFIKQKSNVLIIKKNSTITQRQWHNSVLLVVYIVSLRICEANTASFIKERGSVPYYSMGKVHGNPKLHPHYLQAATKIVGSPTKPQLPDNVSMHSLSIHRAFVCVFGN